MMTEADCPDLNIDFDAVVVEIGYSDEETMLGFEKTEFVASEKSEGG